MNAPTQWLLTMVFVLVGAYCLLRCAYFLRTGRRHPGTAWVTELAHLAISAAMVSMTWVAAGWDRWSLQLTAFLVVAGWFAVRAFAGPTSGQRGVLAASRPILLYEATSFGAMCWMLTRTGGPSGMAGMAGDGMAMSAPAPSPVWATAITIGLVAALFVGAVAWIWQFGRTVVTFTPGASRGAGSVVFGPAGEAACQAAMAVGMAVALLTLT